MSVEQPSSGPRLVPIPPRQWAPEMRDALAALRPATSRHPLPPQTEGRPKGLNVLGTLAHHPELARAYHTLNGHLLFASTIEPRERELLILRVAAVRRAVYEWRQHVVIAGDVGLSSDDVVRIAAGPEAPGWSALDAAMLRAVDELIADASITDDTWASLAAEFDERQLMDLVFTVGAYDLLAMAFRSFQIEPDADLPDDGLVPDLWK